MKEQEIILTVGLPASGKTTWANEFINKNRNYVNINRDDIRLMIGGRDNYHKFTSSREELVTDIAFDAACSAVLKGKSVIISDTNLNRKFNIEWKKFAEEHKIKYTEQLFTDVSVGECIERDKLREYPVGSKVIMGMYNKYKSIWWPETKRDKELENCYIVDVDGTLAEMHNRGPFEWDKVKCDRAKWDVIHVVNALKKERNAKIVIMTGRDGSALLDTISWLDEHGVNYDHVYIRQTKDNRKDVIVKRELYENHVKGKYNVLGVFDDRDQVVDMWRHLGFTCFQVNYGSF